MTHNQEFGAAGEGLAAAILRDKGYNILERNWRFGKLEMDLICEKDGAIVFVEVKTRRGDDFGGGAGAITAHKKRNLIRAAQAWLNRKKLWNKSCRFDVICLTMKNQNMAVEHYANAFEIAPVDSCHAAWQSW